MRSVVTDDSAKVVQTDQGREVRLSYRRGCHEYAVGFASAFFMATTVLGYVILYEGYVPESVYSTAVLFFVVFSFAGAAIMTISYLAPIRFYELLEDEPDS